MNIKILNNQEQEIDVKFPVYKSCGNSFYKLESLRKYICVSSEIHSHCMNNGIEIKVGYEATAAMVLRDGEDITKEEFNHVKEIALSYITRNDFIESTEPATEEEIREKVVEEIKQRFYACYRI